MATVIDRTGVAGEVPDQVAQAIVGEVETQSITMTLGRRVPVSTRDSRIPVLTSVPEAAWLTGETGAGARKPTTGASWENESLIAEEIAAIAVVPDAVIEDEYFDIWESIRPLMSRAFARRIDQAVLFGEGAPASLGPGLVAHATTAAQVVDPTSDSAADLLSAAELVSLTEHAPDGAVVRQGWQFAAARQRTTEVVANPLDSTYPLSLMGMGIKTNPVYWNAAEATAIVADWSSVLFGVRHEMSFEMFSTGILQNDDGTIAVNLLQEDATAMRCVMRIGALLAAPVNSSGEAGVPVAVVGPPTTL